MKNLIGRQFLLNSETCNLFASKGVRRAVGSKYKIISIEARGGAFEVGILWYDGTPSYITLEDLSVYN